MEDKTVRITITESFVKRVEVNVPSKLNSKERIMRYLREHVSSQHIIQLLDATNITGVGDIGRDMDYNKTITTEEVK